MGYIILEENETPTVVSKPRCPAWISIAIGALIIVASAVAVGIFVGYTYFYFEHQHFRFKAAGLDNRSVTLPPNIFALKPLLDLENLSKNKTINNALLSTLIISRIIHLGHALVEDELASLSWFKDKRTEESNKTMT